MRASHTVEWVFAARSIRDVPLGAHPRHRCCAPLAHQGRGCTDHQLQQFFVITGMTAAHPPWDNGARHEPVKVKDDKRLSPPSPRWRSGSSSKGAGVWGGGAFWSRNERSELGPGLRRDDGCGVGQAWTNSTKRLHPDVPGNCAGSLKLHLLRSQSPMVKTWLRTLGQYRAKSS